MAEDEDLSDKVPPDKEDESTSVTNATTKEGNETEDYSSSDSSDEECEKYVKRDGFLKRICDNEECNEYILLCDRLKQQLKEKTEKYVAHVKSLIEDQEILKVKYEGLEEKCKTGEESLLTIVSEADILIASQRKRIEEITKSNTKLRKAIDDKDDEMLRMKYNELKIEYDELVKSHLEKQKQISEQL